MVNIYFNYYFYWKILDKAKNIIVLRYKKYELIMFIYVSFCYCCDLDSKYMYLSFFLIISIINNFHIKKIMKNEFIRKEWENFVNSNEYKKYLNKQLISNILPNTICKLLNNAVIVAKTNIDYGEINEYSKYIDVIKNNITIENLILKRSLILKF